MNATDRRFRTPAECAEQLDVWACEKGIAIRASVIREFANQHWHFDWTGRAHWLRELQSYAHDWEFDRR